MKGYLVLESGEMYEGTLLNSAHAGSTNFERAGEVVFNTSNTGYEEIATDPSYFSQIIVMTAPQQGNYGISKSFWESNQIHIQGFVALEIQNSKRESSWVDQLGNHGVPLLSGIDTRHLTMRLRSGGTPWGAIVAAQNPAQAKTKADKLIQEKRVIEKDWVYAVSAKDSQILKGENASGPRVALLDFGTKQNIVRLAQKYAKEIKIFNSRASFEEISSYNPQAILLTNGPGDPADVKIAVETTRGFIGRRPIYGICMGHQILCLALGAKTYKLKFGHRGSNHPIRDEVLNEIYVSSQNHGYAVDPKTLPAEVKITHTNLNDQSVAGIYWKEKSILGIQYHPEACPGPHDAQGLFRFFFDEMVASYKYE
ncbi:MAG: glutamine-hydrolyzing carbamoyl-phosphate synthase small subunit [Bdellovibrionaceae bacterium]|nr:glutamine-hydrolyzing carbamoyl-phosphate synthase small subunit [Pseudobdellovibrionaceae bacterium]